MSTSHPDTPRTALNLLFHVVVAAGAAPRGAPWLAVTPAELGEVVERLRGRGLAPASLADYLGPAPPGDHAFTISFDDAHPGVLELAAPVLAELRVPATVFVPAAHVGETDRVMDWPAVRALAALPGWTVGSHGAAHERMSWRLYGEGSGDRLGRLAESARRSRTILADRLGTTLGPALFAYPFGEAPRAARRAVREAGYAAAFTVAPDVAWDGDRYGIPRVDGVPLARRDRAPAGDEAPPRGISVVVPACDRPELLREVVRRLAEQSYPADRHEVIVVDDGSGADLRAALGPIIDRSGGRVRLLALEGADPQTFRAGQARQAGADAARFDLVAFLDADVAVDQDFLWHVAYAHGLDPDAVVLGYLSGYNLHDLGHVHGLADIAAAGRLTGDEVPVIPDRSREPSLRACLDDVDALDEPWRLAYTGNLSVSRALLARAGGFSTEFRGWGFEDVDLGVRLHEAGARWVFSRWALGYHLADRGGGPRNPFRDPSPTRASFEGVLRNLDTLERRHPGHGGVAAFCAQVRADVDEICAPPATVGVEVGADEARPWPFERIPAARLRRRRPGGVPLEEVLERLAYAEKLGARAIYLVGGDVALRPELPTILEAARARGIRDVTLETTAIPFARQGEARRLARQPGAGFDAAVVEVLVAAGDLGDEAVASGVAALREAGVRLSARLVLGEGDRAALDRAVAWVRELGLEISSAVAFEPAVAARAAAILGVEVEAR